MSANIFSSLSGSYNYIDDMTSLLSDYSSIKSGAYGSLMKSYVNKVGNSAALKAYQETGSTAVTTDTSSSTSTSSTATASVSSDDYSKYKSTFLDDHLTQYTNDATKTTAADTSISYDTTV